MNLLRLTQLRNSVSRFLIIQLTQHIQQHILCYNNELYASLSYPNLKVTSQYNPSHMNKKRKFTLLPIVDQNTQGEKSLSSKLLRASGNKRQDPHDKEDDEDLL